MVVAFPVLGELVDARHAAASRISCSVRAAREKSRFPGWCVERNVSWDHAQLARRRETYLVQILAIHQMRRAQGFMERPISNGGRFPGPGADKVSPGARFGSNENAMSTMRAGS